MKKLELEQQLNDNIQDILSMIVSYLNEEDRSKVEKIYLFTNEEIKGMYYHSVFFGFKKSLICQGEIKYRDFDDLILFDECCTDFIKKNRSVFDYHNVKVPTQTKIEYSIKTEDLNYNFEYDLFWSNKENKLPNDIAELWFDEIKREIK